MRFLKIVLIVCLTFGICYAQRGVNDKNAILMLKEYYAAHVRVWSTINAVSDVVFNRKLDSLQKKYCTAELRNSSKKYIGEGFDVLTKDHGMDSLSLKTMVIEIDGKNKNIYNVSYDVLEDRAGTPVKRHFTLHVGIITQQGRIKIASVK